MANTCTQMYAQIVFAIWGRTNVIPALQRNGIGEISPLRGLVSVEVNPFLQRLSHEAAGIHLHRI